MDGRVRPRLEEDEEELSDQSSSEDQVDDESVPSGNDSDQSSDESHLEDEMGSISFGALAKAQAALGKRRREADPEPASAAEKVQQLRDRLREIGESKKDPEEATPKNQSISREHARSSKHAPTEISSRRAVTRRREIVPVPKRDIRDPRFEPVSGAVDEEKIRANYAFLEDYRTDEMKELKEAIRKTKDEAARGKLKRELLSMESKRKAQAAKDRQQEVLRAHRSQEKELVKQGKKPFYLKKSEQKKRVLVDRFEGLKEKQVEKVLERKRKKKAQRERRNMPDERRGV
ncbi:MAG: rRNA biogenesis protein rrp36 [Thelocarpon impressellum]|nr:MAG: rRNA biogenesis protein rrp36 [Thelocarpon impressellum]